MTGRKRELDFHKVYFICDSQAALVFAVYALTTSIAAIGQSQTNGIVLCSGDF